MNHSTGPADDLPDEKELLAAAAKAVVAVFRHPSAEQLPPSSIAALRLLETALMLYDGSKQAHRD